MHIWCCKYFFLHVKTCVMIGCSSLSTNSRQNHCNFIQKKHCNIFYGVFIWDCVWHHPLNKKNRTHLDGRKMGIVNSWHLADKGVVIWSNKLLSNMSILWHLGQELKLGSGLMHFFFTFAIIFSNLLIVQTNWV